MNLPRANIALKLDGRYLARPLALRYAACQKGDHDNA